MTLIDFIEIFSVLIQVFEVDAENNMDKRQELAKMLLDRETAFFSFAVVAEPEDTEEDCVDIGYAYVNVNDILETNENYVDKELNCKVFLLEDLRYDVLVIEIFKCSVRRE